jgi:hypothetical protein
VLCNGVVPFASKENTMEPDDPKTPSQLAEEAETIRREALQALQGYAQESKRIGQDTLRSLGENTEDAKATGREALDTVRGLSNDAKDLGKDAAETGKTYARNAVNAAGAKIRSFRERVDDAKADCARYIAEEPVRATLYAAAAGAALTALLLATGRGRRR